LRDSCTLEWGRNHAITRCPLSRCCAVESSASGVKDFSCTAWLGREEYVRRLILPFKLGRWSKNSQFVSFSILYAAPCSARQMHSLCGFDVDVRDFLAGFLALGRFDAERPS
jgi:hypothetical protein